MTIEYRPKVSVGLFIAAVFFVTALVLVWLGTILSASDRSAMEGWTLLLFTAVPIRWFAWGCGAVFVVLGVRVVRSVRREEPSLAISGAGLSLPAGVVIAWNELKSAGVTEKDQLFIEWEDGSVVLSSFELGAEPAAVAAELERRRAAASSPGGVDP